MKYSSSEDIAFIAAWPMNTFVMRCVGRQADARIEKYSAQPLFTTRPYAQKAPGRIVSIVLLPDERKAA